MNIVNFENKHIEEAAALALDNYLEEQLCTPSLPKVDSIPDLSYFAKNGLGVAAFENDTIVGFMGCWINGNAFNTGVKGIYSPSHGHGAVKENRGRIYKRMYEAAAEKWASHDFASHAITIYTHDTAAINAMFDYGFGKRCIDAIRPMESIGTSPIEEITFRELSKAEVTSVRALRRLRSDHMGKSPCFMYSSEDEYREYLEEAEKDDIRLFGAYSNNSIVACMELCDSGEHFITHTLSGLKHIFGATCLPEYRGRGISQALVDYIIKQLKAEGYIYLSVDYESINPNAACFWPKMFHEYTNGLVRRIDECALACNRK